MNLRSDKSSWEGLWSYVHADDQADGGRIIRLAQDVIAQYAMLTGDEIQLFLDKDAVAWGDDWRKRIDESLSTIAFFIPVITPRYFQRPECRRELQFFVDRATKLGIRELVLPLLYVEVPELHQDQHGDELIGLVASFQWEDWRDLRFSAVDSEEYRRAVVRLATRLAEVNRTTEIAVPEGVESREGDRPSDEGPGLIDRLASMEQAIAQMETTLQELASGIETIGIVMSTASEDIQRADAQGKGFAARLTTAKRLARSLEEPVEKISSYATDFSSQLYQVDDGVRIILERAPAELQENPESLGDYCQYLSAVRNMSQAAHEGLGSVQGMLDAIPQLESLSRDLRLPLRKLRQGLTLIINAREITDEWIDLIQASEIDCSDHEPGPLN